MNSFGIFQKDWSIRPDVVELFALDELKEFKEWLISFRKANMSRENIDMLCIPPKSEKLTTALKRVSLKISERDMVKLDLENRSKPRVRYTLWDKILKHEGD